MREGRASSTASIVAAGVLRRYRSIRTRSLVAPESAAIARAALQRSGLRGRVLLWLAGSALAVPLAWLMERLLLDGVTLHYVLRKRAIEEAVRRAIAGGIRRVVVLGAGLDSLGTRLASEGLEVVEVDHPETQALKRAALEAAGIGRVALMPADLSRDTPAEVFNAGPCIVVAEGLLMYLEPERLRELVRGPAKQLQPGSVLVMTFIESHGKGPLSFRNASGIVGWWLRRCGEPFRWGIYPSRLKHLLAAAGFELQDLIDHRELRLRYLQRTPLRSSRLAQGEYIAVAEVQPARLAAAAQLTRERTRP